MGVLLILGSGDRWIIPLIASLVFTAIVILVPAVYEYLLNDRQRHALDAATRRLLPGKKARSSWDNLPDVAHKSDQGLIVGDVGSAKDAGLPRHRH